MKAKLPKNNVMNGQNMGYNKETVNDFQVVVLHKGELKNPVRVALYMGRSASASVVYGSIWVQTVKGLSIAGHGSVGGCGYHKESAAMQEAITSAKIHLFNGNIRTYIDGVGESAMKEALEAITRAAGYRGKMVIV